MVSSHQPSRLIMRAQSRIAQTGMTSASIETSCSPTQKITVMMTLQAAWWSHLMSLKRTLISIGKTLSKRKSLLKTERLLCSTCIKSCSQMVAQLATKAQRRRSQEVLITLQKPKRKIIAKSLQNFSRILSLKVKCLLRPSKVHSIN